MKQLWRFWLVCFLFGVGAACSVPSEVVEITREVVIVETAPPQEGVPVVSRDLFLRATEVTRIVETPEAGAATPTPPEPEPKELVVCQAAEPDSLYLYSSNMLDGQNVRHAIYEPLYTNLSYDYQAVGLEKLPSLVDGDARIQPVEVQAGSTVMDAEGNVVTLEAGVVVVAADGELVPFDGTPLLMNQMQAEFAFKPLVWSDGTAVSADDSVFSFEVNADTENPFGPVQNVDLLERTAAYEATGPLSVRWTGLPGYVDPTYFLNVWQPLPRHQLGDFSAAELLEAEETVRRPLSTGPFVVTAWQPGQFIRVARNPHYYRSVEGLPHLDAVTYRFVPGGSQIVANLISGQCDIATQSGLSLGQAPFLLEAEQNGLVIPHFQSSAVFEHIDFGINSYGDYGDGNGRPDWFEDVRVRQAIMLCTDRQRMVDEVLFGVGEIVHAYVPTVHPLYPDDLRIWPYDPAAANVLLDEVGFVDYDGDGVREAGDGTPFAISYLSTSGAEMRPQIGRLFAENMRNCGLEVTEGYLPASEYFADGPDGPVFSRRFDLAEFAWLTAAQPPCTLWLSENITGPEAEGFGGWGNVNNTGWSHPQFDEPCQLALAALPGTSEYSAAHQNALRLFAEELPILPLFMRVKVSAARPEVQNFSLDPTENSELWNLFEIDLHQ